MKNKNSWDLKPKESIYNKQERIARRDEHLRYHPKDKSTFLCWCGKRHSWADIGTKH